MDPGQSRAPPRFWRIAPWRHDLPQDADRASAYRVGSNESGPTSQRLIAGGKSMVCLKMGDTEWKIYENIYINCFTNGFGIFHRQSHLFGSSWPFIPLPPGPTWKLRPLGVLEWHGKIGDIAMASMAEAPPGHENSGVTFYKYLKTKEKKMDSLYFGHLSKNLREKPELDGRIENSPSMILP